MKESLLNETEKEIPASKLWLKLNSAQRPSKLVDFPRKGDDGEAVGQVAMRILTQEEQMASAASADEFAKKHIKDGKKDEFGYERVYTDEVCVQVLFRACRDPDDPAKPVFPGPKAIRQALTTDECGKLFEHYLTVQAEFGPLIHQMSEEELEAYIDRLVEGASASPFDLLSFELQRLLVLHMAFQLRSSPTDNTSVGPPADSAPAEDTESGSKPEPTLTE